MHIPEQIPVQFSDLINYTGTTAFVPEIHLVLDFEGIMDKERLHKALRLLLDAEPVLGCRFVEHWRKPFWIRLSDEELDNAVLIKEVAGDLPEQEEASQRFFGELIDGSVGPQILALLLPNAQSTRLILKINHVTCDAGGFKALLYRLAEIYCKLGDEPQYVPEPAVGSRSLSQIYSRFSFFQRAAILWHGFLELWDMIVPGKAHQYPSGRKSNSPLRYVFKHFSKERVCQLVKYAKENNATINDLFVTAMLRAMAQQSEWDNKKALRLIGTVDLRRYLPNRRTKALCQTSGIYVVTLGKQIGDTFIDTLCAVKERIGFLKAHYFGLSTLLAIFLIYFPYPFSLYKKMMKKQWRHALDNGNTGMTNLGPIDSSASDFGSLSLKSAHMLTPASTPPNFVCGLSGFDGTLTLSSGVYPSAIPPEQVKELFDMVDAELP